MKWLFLKRVVIAFVLITTIFGLAYYNYVTASTGYDGLTRLANNRKQKTDYNALFDNSNFKTITVVFDETVFDELLVSMEMYFAQYGTYQDNTLHKVDMIYHDGLGNDFTIEEVGFRTKSNTSRNLPKTLDWRGRVVYHQTSFQLQFNATFDYEDTSNEYGVLNNREVFNLDQLNFEFSKSYNAQPDEAMISEAFSYYLYRQAGVVTSNVSYGLVYFQIGEDVVGFGFYSFIEPIDSNFLSKHFNSNVIGDYGDLYKCTDVDGIASLGLDSLNKVGINRNEINLRYNYALKNHQQNGTRTDFSNIQDLITNIQDQTYFNSHADNLIDIDAFLRMLAMDFLIGNTDDYRFNGNNYYLYFDVYTDQVTFIPFDLDNSLGFGKHQDLSGNYGIYYDIFAHTDDIAILVDRVLAIEAYKSLYLDYLTQYAQDYFLYDSFESDLIQAKALYETVLIEENHLGNQVFGLRNAEWYFDLKADSVLNQIAQVRG